MQGPSTWTTSPLIVITSGAPNTGFFVYNGTPALGNPPVFSVTAPGVTTDPYGNTVVNEAVAYGGSREYSQLANGAVYFGSLNPSTKLVVNGFVIVDDVLTGGTTQPGLEIQSPDVIGAGLSMSGILLAGESVDTTVAPFIQMLGKLLATTPGSTLGFGSAETWHALGAMSNGWSVGGHAQYRIMPTGELALSMKDILLGTTFADGTVLWSAANGLRAGYRPANNRRIVAWAPGNANVAIELETDGSIQCFGFGSVQTRYDLYWSGPIDE